MSEEARGRGAGDQFATAEVGKGEGGEGYTDPRPHNTNCFQNKLYFIPKINIDPYTFI